MGSEIKTSLTKTYTYIYIYENEHGHEKSPKGEREISCIQTIIFRVQIGFRGGVYGDYTTFLFDSNYFGTFYVH